VLRFNHAGATSTFSDKRKYSQVKTSSFSGVAEEMRKKKYQPRRNDSPVILGYSNFLRCS
jgi:hypothetical protein